MLALAAAAAALRAGAASSAPAAPDSGMEVPPIPAEVARPLAIGFGSLLSDFTFIEAIQLLALRKTSFTSEQSAPFDRQLRRLLEYATDVDPHFAGAYRFTGTGLAHETVDGKAMGVIATVQILEKGVREVPDDWHIPFLLGYMQANYLGEFAQAAHNLSLAAKEPGAPPYMALLATRVAAQGGQISTALALAQTMLAQANEDETRKQWQQRVLLLKMEQDLERIEAAMARYRSERGAPPPSLQALVDAGYLRAIPPEPHGGAYLLGKDGAVRSNAAARLRIYGGVAHMEVH